MEKLAIKGVIIGHMKQFEWSTIRKKIENVSSLLSTETERYSVSLGVWTQRWNMALEEY